jgi:small neutral amino acid transporter SnatA (MarC family)
MNGLLSVVAWLAALNPPRTRLGLPERVGRGRMEVVGPGAIIGIAVLLGVSGGARGLLDALEISPEMFRIAAGFVLVIVGAWMLFRPVPDPEPVADGFRGALWPVAYPRVVSPETLVLAVTTGASDGVMVGPTALAGAALIALAALPMGPSGRRISAAIGRVFAVGLVVVAIWLAVQGVREV